MVHNMTGCAVFYVDTSGVAMLEDNQENADMLPMCVYCDLDSIYIVALLKDRAHG